MTREEENARNVDVYLDKIKHLGLMSTEERNAFNIGLAATMLADISRSLAIIADKLSEK